MVCPDPCGPGNTCLLAEPDRAAGSSVRFCRYVSTTRRAVLQHLDQALFAHDDAVHHLVHGGGRGRRLRRRGLRVRRGRRRRPGCAVAVAPVGVEAERTSVPQPAATVGCESAGCCATALSETSKVAETIQFKVRITLISIVSSKTNFFNTPSGKQRVRSRWNPLVDRCVEPA